IIVSIPVFIAVAAFSFYYFVWSYAVLDNIRMTLDAANPPKVRVTYEVKYGGRVNYYYGRISSEYGRVSSETSYEAGEKDDFELRVIDQSEFSVSVRSRRGIFPSWHTEHFSKIPRSAS